MVYFHVRQLFTTLLLTLLFSIISFHPALAQEQQKFWPTLTVTGRGVETISTNLSQIGLTVEVRRKTAQEAQQEAARKSSAVVSLLKLRNVEKLQTTRIDLSPVYSYTNNEQKITGYVANNSLNFRVPTENAGRLLDEVVKAGAIVNGISFVANEESIASAQREAIRGATQDAQEQANTVFSTLGLRAGQVLSIHVNHSSAPPPPILYRVEAMKAASADASTPVIGGEQQVEASVTLQISY